MTAGDLVAAVEAFLAEDHPERCPFEDEIPQSALSAHPFDDAATLTTRAKSRDGQVVVMVGETEDGAGLVIDVYLPWGRRQIVAHVEEGIVGPFDPSADANQPPDDDYVPY